MWEFSTSGCWYIGFLSFNFEAAWGQTSNNVTIVNFLFLKTQSCAIHCWKAISSKKNLRCIHIVILSPELLIMVYRMFAWVLIIFLLFFGSYIFPSGYVFGWVIASQYIIILYIVAKPLIEFWIGSGAMNFLKSFFGGILRQRPGSVFSKTIPLCGHVSQPVSQWVSL